jgi:lipopolysaccharide transport system ATP-binding protein
MSSENAVRVERISKLYRIGLQPDARSFRETLTDLLALRFRREDPHARDLWALREVSFEVRRGEAIGIIGQNGAGKSTLLKILSRITEPTSGRIEVHGRVSSLLEVGTGFHGELTGRENIQLNGAILGMSRLEIRRRFDDIVAFAEVERFIDTPVKYYSSGMYMRLAFAVAAHLEPDILVVDEVLAVGDAAFQAKCLRKMSDVASHGRTVLFVSHNMPAVQSLCQTAILLREGRVVERGTSMEVVARYLQHATARSGREEVANIIASLPEDPVFRLRSIRTLQRGHDVTTVLNGESLHIEIAFDVLATTLGLHVYFQLLDLEEVILVESIHNGDDSRAPLVQAGSYVATAVIPANLLAARPYQLRIHAGIANVRACMPEAIRMNVDVQQSGIVNQAYPGYQTPARLAPHLEWTLERR